MSTPDRTAIEDTAAGIPARSPLTWRKTASGHALYLRDQGKPLATVDPDGQHAGMWRIHMPDGWISDLKNLPFAKEGALRSVLAHLNRNVTPTGPPPARSAAAHA